ncbi:hypothetical protein GRS96_05810 [Rathayibacter sp. VKM Ac-2803]|uniref:hypothetical protein n=1 Tax=unclassified Rathayibacter TaxID=2609250 RepID=UPI001359AE61|nr:MULTISPECIES: hypothetical protein [unclassified Rathayibacter]MWV48795.1 hypothetical protein [Rathayibacter sp. VKM Ac-2803]MWV60404.1 hypothetical protein [Rathayibacter sp. VKM Ac-2754]
MVTGFNFVFVLYAVFVVVIAVVLIVLAVLLCRLAIAARENQLTTARLRELQIERMLAEDDE